MFRFMIWFIIPVLVSCSILTKMLPDLVGGEKGGINTELVVGDKEQVVGSNLDVKANEVGKVVGNSDNSVNAQGAAEVQVVNNHESMLLIILAILGWMLDTPKTLWNRWRNRNKNML